jgi:cyclohexyl-isocyanide hydratase
MDLTICMVLFPDAQALDVVGPLEIFRTAPGVRVEIASASASPCAMTSGVFVVPTMTLDDERPCDVLFVPGGDGLTIALADERYRAFVTRQAEHARYVTSVCTGSLLLGAAGVLRGYRAASHWRYAELLRLCGAEPVDERAS